MTRPLADRGIGGIRVRLLWDDDPTTGSEIRVEYEDERDGVTFVIHPPPERALDAFYHPNAYLTAAC